LESVNGRGTSTVGRLPGNGACKLGNNGLPGTALASFPLFEFAGIRRIGASVCAAVDKVSNSKNCNETIKRIYKISRV